MGLPQCVLCNTVVVVATRGRPRKYCSQACAKLGAIRNERQRNVAFQATFVDEPRKLPEPLHANLQIWRLNDNNLNPKLALVLEAKNKPCSDCHKSYPYFVMDLDHARGTKKFNLSRSTLYTYDEIIIELAKCDVVCANCHRIRTHKRLEEKKRYID